MFRKAAEEKTFVIRKNTFYIKKNYLNILKFSFLKIFCIILYSCCFLEIFRALLKIAVSCISYVSIVVTMCRKRGSRNIFINMLGYIGTGGKIFTKYM